VTLFENGFRVDNELTVLPSHLEVLSFDESKDESEILITIHEGKFHQVKRMFEAVNSQVHYLKRIKFATLTLDDTLPLGAYRPLNNEEINNLNA
jgi:16S rRNA pseudouridine516 synthase